MDEQRISDPCVAPPEYPAEFGDMSGWELVPRGQRNFIGSQQFKDGRWEPCRLGFMVGAEIVRRRVDPPRGLESARDWAEDFSHENGNYTNRCAVCAQLFIGHKRRPLCKLCSTK